MKLLTARSKTFQTSLWPRLSHAATSLHVAALLAASAILVAFVVTPIPGAHASTTLSLSPFGGVPGSTVTVTGSGFAPSQTITILFGGATIGTGSTDAMGRFALFVTVPSISGCEFTVTAADGLGNVAAAVFTTCRVACTVIGQTTFTANMGTTALSGFRFPVRAVFKSSGALFVTDAQNNRVLGFFPPLSTGMSAGLVLGYSTFTRAEPPVAQNELFTPHGITIDSSGQLWVTDGWSRVLRFSPPFSNAMNADLVIGQRDFTTWRPVANASGAVGPADVLTNSLGTLFVADAGYNRIMLYHPPYSNGMSASVVIGQTTFTASSASTSASGLRQSGALSLDSLGNLWVADSGNNRVLKFSPPFSNGMSANLVVGQSTFTSGTPSFSPSGLSDPSDLDFDTLGNLWIADTGNNRILKFAPPFSSGMSASAVLGQPGFFTTTFSTSQAGLKFPNGIAFDTFGSLWVVDSGNNRVLEYCFAQSTTTTSVHGGSSSVDNSQTTGVTVSVTGSSAPDGTGVTVFTARLPGPSAITRIGLSGAAYFDVKITGITDGMARVCITDLSVSSSTVMQYWDGTAWVNAANQSVSGNTICGDIPVSALRGTNIAIGEGPVSSSPFTSSYSTLLVLLGLSAGVLISAVALYKRKSKRS